jgi:hypothetical protein
LPPAQLEGDRAAQFGKLRTEFSKARELGEARNLLPTLVIDVLFALSRVAAGSLQMAGADIANPYVAPGGRDG